MANWPQLYLWAIEILQFNFRCLYIYLCVYLFGGGFFMLCVFLFVFKLHHQSIRSNCAFCRPEEIYSEQTNLEIKRPFETWNVTLHRWWFTTFLHVHHMNIKMTWTFCGFSNLFFFLSHSFLMFYSLFFRSHWLFFFLPSIDMSVSLSGLCLALPVSAPAGSC